MPAKSGHHVLAFTMFVCCLINMSLGQASQSEEVEFRWWLPQRSRRLLSKNATTYSEASLPETVSIAVKPGGTPLQLRLRRQRELLHGKAKHYLHYRNGSVVEGPRPEACFYIGEVTGKTVSSGGSVTMSACGNMLRGLIIAGDSALTFSSSDTIAPKAELERAKGFGTMRLEEVVDAEFLARQRSIRRFLLGSQTNASKHEAVSDRHRRLTSVAVRKYVEVLAINDNSRLQRFGGITGAQEMAQHTAEVLSLVNGLYHSSIDGGSFPYEIVVVLVSQHTFVDEDPWHNVRMSGVETDMSDLLNKMHQWGFAQQSAGAVPAHDNRVLLSSRDFLGGVIGLASVSTMCSGGLSGGVNMCRDAMGCSVVVAHEMGHNFGMHHDSDGNGCQVSGNVMEAVGTGADPESFSRCSATYMTEFFTTKYARNGECLEEPPTVVDGEPLCGNGFVECGDDPENCVEQCDCGLADCSGVDHCCNGTSCLFVEADYECSDNLGLCCNNCRFVTAEEGRVCRPQRNGCDLQEICPGGTGSCPLDLFVYPGSECTTESNGETFEGLCYGGQCHSQGYTCKVDLTRDFFGSYDITEPCATYNDDCNTMVCHDASSSDPTECVQDFTVHDQLMPVPDGMPCWFQNDARGVRRGMCADGQCVPPDVLAVVPLCGNGGIDFGEQCDCGSDADSDPCCDCCTCLLKADSACSALEPCCNPTTCELKSAGEVCRAAVDADCDIAETCSGSSGRCPPDEGAHWGTVCQASDGVNSTCYGKVCLPSLDTQCNEQFGGTYVAKADVYQNRSNGAGSGTSPHSCTGLWCCPSCSTLDGTYVIGGVGAVTNPYICNGCTRETTWSEFNFNNQVVQLWTSGAVEGSVLSDWTKMCRDNEETTPAAAADCASTEFFDASVGVCLPCDLGCSGCSGPTAFDCNSPCVYGEDSNGRCALTAAQVAFATGSGAAGAAAQPACDGLVRTTASAGSPGSSTRAAGSADSNIARAQCEQNVIVIVICANWVLGSFWGIRGGE